MVWFFSILFCNLGNRHLIFSKFRIFKNVDVFVVVRNENINNKTKIRFSFSAEITKLKYLIISLKQIEKKSSLEDFDIKMRIWKI